MSGLSTLGDLTLQISRSTSNLLSASHSYDYAISDETKEQQLQKMLAEAEIIKSAADKIMCEVQHMHAMFIK